jgi:hypothetical protein
MVTAGLPCNQAAVAPHGVEFYVIPTDWDFRSYKLGFRAQP